MNIGIVGLGIIGASVAKSIKKHTDYKVFGADIDKTVVQKALHDNTIDFELKDNFKDCNIIIIGLYYDDVIKYLENNSSKFGKNSIVTDLCGIKKDICELGYKLSNKYGFTFIGGHPMAGKEVWGYDNSSENLFENASMILTPSQNTDLKNVKILSSFYKNIMFKAITVATPEKHDIIISYTSQLAHILSNAYVKSPEALEHNGFSAGSFSDLTRVAYLNSDMWTRIFIANGKNLVTQIDTLIDNLSDLRNAIYCKNENELHSLLEEGSKIKSNL